MPLVQDLIKRAMTYQYFGPESPITMHYVAGESNILVITGDNASGKSFVGRAFKELLEKKQKIKMMRIGMDRRTMGGMERAFMFGDESWESTGSISLHAVQGAMKSCGGWKYNHAIYFDEPDTGLSEANQLALGTLLAQNDWPKQTKLVCVATHSRHLVAELALIKPHWLGLGDNMSLAEFLKPPRPKTVEELLKLPDIAIKRFRAISKIMNQAEGH